MARHKWTKKGKRPWIYWECENCGCSRQKQYGMPWEYFRIGERWPLHKSPVCKIQKSKINEEKDYFKPDEDGAM